MYGNHDSKTVGITGRWLGVALLLLAGVAGTAQAGASNVTICHVPPGNPANHKTMQVAASAVSAHLGHGDFADACENLCQFQPERCSDGIACTRDVCNPDGSCSNPPVVCSTGEVCNQQTGDCVGPDTDGDGVRDSIDNCPNVANANQADVGLVNGFNGGNGIGDACDCPCFSAEDVDAFTAADFGAIPECNDVAQQTVLSAHGNPPIIETATYVGGGCNFQVSNDEFRAYEYLDPQGADLPRHQACQTELRASQRWQELCH